MDNNEILNRVMKMLDGQRFIDWYNTTHDDYISGDMAFGSGKTDAQCREELKKDVARMMDLQ